MGFVVDFWLHSHRCFSCHALCKVVIEPVAQRRELVILPRRVNAVVDGDIADVVLWEDDLDELAGFQVITAQAR